MQRTASHDAYFVIVVAGLSDYPLDRRADLQPSERSRFHTQGPWKTEGVWRKAGRRAPG